jgi:hypothetical protein
VANKDKKEACEALSRLKDYLCRDKKALDLVDQIERYMGKLRREQSQFKADIERLEAANATLHEQSLSHSAEVDRLRNAATAAESRRLQAETQAKMATQALEELEQRLTPPLPNHELTVSEQKFYELVKSLKRSMPNCPRPSKVIPFRNERGYIFDLDDFVPNLTEDEFARLGKFIVVSHVGMLEMVGFTSEPLDHRNRCRDLKKSWADKAVAAFVHWSYGSLIAEGKGVAAKLMDAHNEAGDKTMQQNVRTIYHNGID